MNLRQTSVLLPCHSLADFPTFLEGPDATSLLAGWTALWHPALLAAIGELPTWRRADDPPPADSLNGELVVVPRSCHQSLPVGWLDRFRDTFPENPTPICDYDSRDEIISSLIRSEVIGGEFAGHASVDEFFSLGFCYLQVELLTCAMHYSGIINQTEMAAVVASAAKAAAGGNAATAHERLGQAFDLVTQARQHFYPVDFHLLDVTLLAEATWGEPLRRELAEAVPTNLLATAEQIAVLATREPDTMVALRTSIQQGTAAVIGGPPTDRPLRSLPPETLLDELQRGRQIYGHCLDAEVNVFAQFRSDVTPLFPQLLKSLGFAGALLTTFDGHSPPAGHQARLAWTGAGDTTIDAFWATPLDAARDESFLALADHVSDSMHHEHVATVLLAGWSGERSPFFNDLRCSARFGPVLGKFLTLDDYFAASADSEHWSPPAVVVPDRVGRVDVAASDRSGHAANVVETHDQLLGGVADVVSDAAAGELTAPAVTRLQAIERQVLDNHKGARGPLGTLAVNAWSFARRPRQGAAGDDAAPWFDAPLLGMGYHWQAGDGEPPPIPLAADNRICNELIEVVVAAETGGVRSIKAHRDRRTRASQRLVFVTNARAEERRAVDNPAGESRMQADLLEITRNDSVAGAIHSRGQLLGRAGRVLARFEQTCTLPRGERHVVIDVSLESVESPAEHSWHSYFASRLVWDDRLDAELHHGVSWLAEPTERRRIVTPEWIQIARADGGAGWLTLYPHGLAHHQRIGPRALDTLLTATADPPHRFRLAIGLDDPYPTQTALGLLTPTSHYVTKAHHTGDPVGGWFLHVGAKNVIVTHLSRVDQPSAGVRLRLLETEGRGATVPIAAFRPLADGRQTDFCGRTLNPLKTDNGRLVVELRPYQWIQLEGYWT